MAEIKGLKFTKTKGGVGSGHHGHAGRPGQVGGSATGAGAGVGPRQIAGQPDLKGEKTSALGRTLDGFREDIKKPGISKTSRRNLQGGIENIQAELTYRKQLGRTLTGFRADLAKATSSSIKRGLRASIAKIQAELNEREGKK